jgi:tetratricopeptide (TPR) repeat protein
MRRLLVIRGDLLVGTLAAAEAETAYRQALALPAPSAVRAHIAWRLAQSLSQRGQAAEAMQLCQETIATMGPGDTLLRARLTSVECQALWVLSRYEEAIFVGTQALRLADQLAHLAPHLADEIRARTYYALSNVYYYQRSYKAALEHTRELVDTAHRADLPALEYAGLTLLGGLLTLYVGQTELALFYLDQAKAGFEEIGDSYGLGNCLGFKAVAHYLLNEFELAQHNFAQVEALLHQVGDLEGLATYRTNRGLFLLEFGRVDEAQALGERLIAEFSGHEACWHTLYTMHLLSIAQLVAGDAGAALTAVKRAWSLPAWTIDPSVRGELESTFALALLVTDGPDRAQQALNEAPLGDVGVWTELNRELVNGALALARGDTAATTAIARSITERAEAAGYRVYSQRAARLAAAVNNPPPLAELPRLLWVMDR